MVVESIVLKVTIYLILSVVNSVASRNFDRLVVKGKSAKIEDYPHATYLSIECWIGYFTSYGCGSSIINQAIVLTAAHCFETCKKDETYVTAYVGNSEAGEGTAYLSATYKMHEDHVTPFINDIALVRLRKNIKFAKTVRRVSLMRNPPEYKSAKVAGWGYTSEDDTDHTSYDLMEVKQKVRSRLHCMDQLNMDIEKGVICGGSKNAKSYISNGDSGSALMVEKHIQIGIVSYKAFSRSKSVGMYTDVAYFYDWIQVNSKDLYCSVFNFPATEPDYYS